MFNKFLKLPNGVFMTGLTTKRLYLLLYSIALSNLSLLSLYVLLSPPPHPDGSIFLAWIF